MEILLKKSKEELKIIEHWESLFKDFHNLFVNTEQLLANYSLENPIPIKASNTQITFIIITNELKELQNELESQNNLFKSNTIDASESLVRKYRKQYEEVKKFVEGYNSLVKILAEKEEEVKENYWNSKAQLEILNKWNDVPKKELKVAKDNYDTSLFQYKEFVIDANRKIKKIKERYNKLINDFFTLKETGKEAIVSLIKNKANILKTIGTVMMNKGIAISNFSGFHNSSDITKQIISKCTTINDHTFQLYCTSLGFTSPKQIPNIKHFIEDTFTKLINSKAITPEEQRSFKFILDSTQGREVFANCLTKLKEHILITLKDAFRYLVNLVLFMLTMFEFKQEKNVQGLVNVLVGAKYLFMKVI